MEIAFRLLPPLPTGPSSNGTDPDTTSEGRDSFPPWLQVTISEGVEGIKKPHHCCINTYHRYVKLHRELGTSHLPQQEIKHINNGFLMIQMTPISLKQDLAIYNQGWPQTIDSSA